MWIHLPANSVAHPMHAKSVPGFVDVKDVERA
jgi:hypothetical protein